MEKYSVPLFTGNHIDIQIDNTYGPTKLLIDDLQLKPVYTTDIGELQELHTRSQSGESYIEFVKWNETDTDLDTVTQFKQSAEELWGECFLYSIYRGEKLIGIASLSLEDYTMRADIGVWIDKDDWDSNIRVASDTFSALASISFEFFDRHIVKGTVDSQDIHSIQSLQQSIVGLGGSFEGVFRQYTKQDGEDTYIPRHVIVYSVTKDEFYTIRDSPKSLDSALENTPFSEVSVSSEI